MSLAVTLRTGAILGSLCGSSVGGALGLYANKDVKLFARFTIAGVVTGIALAAIAHFGGQAAALGATAGLLCVTPLVLDANSDISRLVLAALGVTFGASLGYAIGLIG